MLRISAGGVFHLTGYRSQVLGSGLGEFPVPTTGSQNSEKAHLPFSISNWDDSGNFYFLNALYGAKTITEGVIWELGPDT